MREAQSSETHTALGSKHHICIPMPLPAIQNHLATLGGRLARDSPNFVNGSMSNFANSSMPPIKPIESSLAIKAPPTVPLLMRSLRLTVISITARILLTLTHNTATHTGFSWDINLLTILLPITLRDTMEHTTMRIPSFEVRRSGHGFKRLPIECYLASEQYLKPDQSDGNIAD